MADNGTILLDEIGEMTLRMQGLLLRFLETGEIQKVGAERVGAVDALRLVAFVAQDGFEREDDIALVVRDQHFHRAQRGSRLGVETTDEGSGHHSLVACIFLSNQPLVVVLLQNNPLYDDCEKARLWTTVAMFPRNQEQWI